MRLIEIFGLIIVQILLVLSIITSERIIFYIAVAILVGIIFRLKTPHHKQVYLVIGIMLLIFLTQAFLITGGNFWQSDSYQYYRGINVINQEGYLNIENPSYTYSTYGFYVLYLILSLAIGMNNILIFYVLGIVISTSILGLFFFLFLKKNNLPIIPEGLFLIFGIESFFIAGITQFAPQALGTSFIIFMAYLDYKCCITEKKYIWQILIIFFGAILLIIHLWSFFFFIFCYFLITIINLLYNNNNNNYVKKRFAILVILISLLLGYIFFSPWIDTTSISKYNYLIPIIWGLSIIIILLNYSIIPKINWQNLKVTNLKNKIYFLKKNLLTFTGLIFFLCLSSILIIYGSNLYPTNSTIFDLILNHFGFIFFITLILVGILLMVFEENISFELKVISISYIIGSLIFLIISLILLKLGLFLFYPWRHIIYLCIFTPIILGYFYKLIDSKKYIKDAFFLILLVLILIVSQSAYQFQYLDEEISSAEWAKINTLEDTTFVTDERLQGIFSGLIDRELSWKKQIFLTGDYSLEYKTELIKFDVNYIIFSEEYSIQGARLNQLGGSYNIYNNFSDLDSFKVLNAVYSNGKVDIYYVII